MSILMASGSISSPFISSSSSCGDLPRNCLKITGNINNTSRCFERLLLRGIAGALSCVLFASAPSLAASSSPFSSPPPSSEICLEDKVFQEEPPESLTNEGLVEEAWEVVNESFLGNSSWSPEKWLEKKKEILQWNIQKRSRAHDIIRKMLASLGDAYTRFLAPSEFSKMARYDMTGIGINLREIPDDDGSVKLKILGVILDGPAHSAGVRQGDELLSVNGMDVKGKSAFDVSSMLQGPKETFVTIEVKHGNCGPIQSIRIQRQLVARTPVFYRLEKGNDGSSFVGYIQIKEFNALARKDLLTALKRLQDSGASFYVLDLRDNLGGLVEAGIEVAKLFLDTGETVIYTVGRDPQVQKSIVAETAPLVTAPVIVATALHDNCKAILVGERTFGKGLIQSVFELHDGSGVVVTIGKYVTPSHKDINGNGIQPDFSRLPDMSKVRDYFSHCQV